MLGHSIFENVFQARASSKSVVFLDPYQDTPAFTTSNRNTHGGHDSSVKWQKTKANDDTANSSYMSITAMKEYSKTSFDELRVQDYIMNPSMSYTGEKNAAGARHGQGTRKWANGNSYVGAWVAGKQEGQDTMKWANGDSYVGAWVAGKQALAHDASSSEASRAQLLYGCRIQVTSTCACNGKRGRILSVAPPTSAPLARVKAQTSAQPQARILKSTFNSDFLW